MGYDKQLRIKFNAPLQSGDTETTTFGCRANNPDICANCYLEDVCAFCRVDHICVKPSAAWKKQYKKLVEAQDADQ